MGVVQRWTRWMLDAIRRDLRKPNYLPSYAISFLVFGVAFVILASGGHFGYAVIPALGALLSGWIVVREIRRRRTGNPPL